MPLVAREALEETDRLMEVGVQVEALPAMTVVDGIQGAVLQTVMGQTVMVRLVGDFLRMALQTAMDLVGMARQAEGLLRMAHQMETGTVVMGHPTVGALQMVRLAARQNLLILMGQVLSKEMEMETVVGEILT